MERDSARGAYSARYAQTGLGFSARPKGPESLKKSHVIETEFQPGLKKEREHAHRLCFRTSVNAFCARAAIEHVIAAIFHGGRSEISARGEIRHVIRP